MGAPPFRLVFDGLRDLVRLSSTTFLYNCASVVVVEVAPTAKRVTLSCPDRRESRPPAATRGNP